MMPEELDPRTACACGCEATEAHRGHLLCPECKQVLEALAYDSPMFEYDDIPQEKH